MSGEITSWACLLISMVIIVCDVAVLGTTNRRLRRQLDGRCLKCGYDLRESPASCPECGNTPAAESPELCC